jgi:hypothetical protein
MRKIITAMRPEKAIINLDSSARRGRGGVQPASSSPMAAFWPTAPRQLPPERSRHHNAVRLAVAAADPRVPDDLMRLPGVVAVEPIRDGARAKR